MKESGGEVRPTGHAALEREHDGLLARLREIGRAADAADPSTVLAALEAFLREAAEHFAHEEQTMHANGYLQLARHKEAHDLFLAEAGGHAAALRRDAATASPDSLQRAAERLLGWFTFHVAANDVPLGVFLSARQRAARLREAEEPLSPANATRRSGP